MAESTIELQQVCSGISINARLVGVTPDELDLYSASAIFGYFRVTARSDQSLSAAECDGLSYTVRGGEEERDEVDAAVVVSDKLNELSMLIEKAIENDPDISEQDANVIRRALPDGSDESAMNLQLIQQHLMHILQNFFSSEVIQDCTPIKLFINFAMVVRYCYNFFKKVCVRLRELVAAVFPEPVFNVLCRVVSVLLRHLTAIDWRTLLTRMGGWTGAVRSLALTEVTTQWVTLPMPHPNIFLGISVFSVGISVLSAGMYIYLSRSS